MSHSSGKGHGLPEGNVGGKIQGRTCKEGKFLKKLWFCDGKRVKQDDFGFIN